MPIMLGRRLSGYATVLVDHKKKAVVALSLALYGLYQNKARLKRNDVFGTYCNLAKEYGDEILRPNALPRRITVLLNGCARNGKAESNFERYALPLLHLAGVRVQLLKPKSEKEMFEAAASADLNDSDTVYVVGGDGTLSKVVAGLIERQKNPNDRTLKSSPSLAVFPGGFTNSFVNEILAQNHDGVKWYCDNVMSVLAGLLSSRSIAEVTIDEQEPFYMTQFAHFGRLAEVESSKHKYWFCGSLKAPFAYACNLFRQKPQSCDFSISYSEPCSGCSTCEQPQRVNDDGVKRWWWQKLIGRPSGSASATAFESDSRVNEQCDKLTEFDVKTVEISVGFDKSTKLNDLRVACGPASPSRLETIVEGYERNRGSNSSGLWPTDAFLTNAFEAKSLRVRCKEHSDVQKVVYIDGERFNFTRQVSVKVKPNALRYFIPHGCS